MRRKLVAPARNVKKRNAMPSVRRANSASRLIGARDLFWMFTGGRMAEPGAPVRAGRRMWVINTKPSQNETNAANPAAARRSGSVSPTGSASEPIPQDKTGVSSAPPPGQTLRPHHFPDSRACLGASSFSFRWAAVRGLSFVGGSNPPRCASSGSSVVEQPPKGVIPRQSLPIGFSAGRRTWVIA